MRPDELRYGKRIAKQGVLLTISGNDMEIY